MDQAEKHDEKMVSLASQPHHLMDRAFGRIKQHLTPNSTYRFCYPPKTPQGFDEPLAFVTRVLDTYCEYC